MKFKKKALRSIAALLCLVLFCALVPFPASAATTVASGTCGAADNEANVTWTLDSDGVLTISGSGEMASYNTDLNSDADNVFQPWNAYLSDIKSVVISDGITYIGSCAFHKCKNLTTANVPDSVTKIGWGAFWACYSLTSIHIPEGVTTIWDYTFYSAGLTSVTIPDSVTVIKNRAFKMSNLETIYIGKGLRTLYPQAFGYCSKLKTVYFTGDPAYCAESNAFANPGSYNYPTAYYPEDNEKWTAEAIRCITYGVLWQGYCSHSKITYVDPVTATCQTPARDGYWSCPYCQKLYLDSTATTETTLDDVTHSYGTHNIISVDAADATCTTDGNIKHYTCSTCHTLYEDANGATETTWDKVKIAAGHKLTKVDAKAATCTSDGNEAYYTCSGCTDIFTDSTGTTTTTLDKVKIAAGHKLTKVDAKAATCTSDGNSAYYTCSGCTDIFEDANGTLKTDPKAVTITAKGHSFTIKDTTAKRSDATTSAAATYWYTCSVCGAASDTFYFTVGEPLVTTPETATPVTEPEATTAPTTPPATEPAATQPKQNTTPSTPSTGDSFHLGLMLVLMLTSGGALVMTRKKI